MNRNWISLDDKLEKIEIDASFFDAISQIRKKSIELGWNSWTSAEYQNSVLEIALRLKSHPGDIIELGAFQGGMTVFLAAVANRIEKKLYCLDIDANCMKTVEQHLEAQGIPRNNICLFTGTIDAFMEAYPLDMPPALVIIDAFHTYEACRHDLATVLTHYPCAECIVLHDYGLSYSPEAVSKGIMPTVFTAVKLAVHHVLGYNAPLMRLGLAAKNDDKILFEQHRFTAYSAAGQTGDRPIYQTIFAPGEPEAVVFMPGMLEAEAFHRAATYVLLEQCLKERRRKIIPPHPEKFTLLSGKQQWNDYEIKYSCLTDLSHKMFRLLFINEGTELNMRFALLAPDSDNVAEKWFPVPGGFSTVVVHPDKMGALRGLPDIVKVKQAYLGGIMNDTGVKVFVEEI